MKVGQTEAVTVIGAGLAGALLSVLLAQRGFRVHLFERNPDPRRGNAAGGRSINLALAERGRHALRRASLLEAVDRFTLPMRGRALHALDGNVTLQPYGAADNEVIWSTHRALLNRLLLDAAEATGRVELRFDHRLADIDWDTRALHFAGAETPSHRFQVLIGADGGGSAVRRSMQTMTDLGVSEELLDHGYRELTIPATPEGGFAMDPAALHIWPRSEFMLIALPNDDRSFTVTLFLANEGDPSFASLGDWPAQQAFCEQYFPDAVPLMPELRDDFRNNPVGLLGTIRCRRWALDGRALLIGDAAHAVVPFHGQGMNAAFEDCVALVDLLDDPQQDWAQVFERLEEERRDNANAIADMALENYDIMRESVRHPQFLLRKALEHELERRHGERFIARYSLVMFHRIPYAEAFRRGEIQAALLDELLDGIERLEDVDFDRAARLIGERLELIRNPSDR